MEGFLDTLRKLYGMTALSDLIAEPTFLLMYLLAFGLLYLGIVKKYEPLLLIPIAFGVLIANFPGGEMGVIQTDASGMVKLADGTLKNIWEMPLHEIAHEFGIMNYLYYGLIKTGLLPPIIFMGVGAMTDFGPMLRNLKLAIFGAAAQFGIFAVLLVSLALGFTPAEAASLGIIGGADGPTAIFTTIKLAPHLLGPIAIAAYSYMALVPVIIPLVVKLTCTKKELMINMKEQDKLYPDKLNIKNMRAVKIIFPIAVTTIVAIFVPTAVPLVGMLMFGAFQCGQQRSYECRNDFPGALRGSHYDGGRLPQPADSGNYCRRFLCLCPEHCQRYPDGENLEPVLQEEDQSSHRCHRTVGRAYGQPRLQWHQHQV